MIVSIIKNKAFTPKYMKIFDVQLTTFPELIVGKFSVRLSFLAKFDSSFQLPHSIEVSRERRINEISLLIGRNQQIESSQTLCYNHFEFYTHSYLFLFEFIDIAPRNALQVLDFSLMNFTMCTGNDH